MKHKNISFSATIRKVIQIYAYICKDVISTSPYLEAHVTKAKEWINTICCTSIFKRQENWLFKIYNTKCKYQSFVLLWCSKNGRIQNTIRQSLECFIWPERPKFIFKGNQSYDTHTKCIIRFTGDYCKYLWKHFQ